MPSNREYEQMQADERRSVFKKPARAKRSGPYVTYKVTATSENGEMISGKWRARSPEAAMNAARKFFRDQWGVPEPFELEWRAV